jgi:malate dehydrogenase
MPTKFGQEGLEWSLPEGDDEDMAALQHSYEHVTALRDQVVEMGVIPPPSAWRIP